MADRDSIRRHGLGRPVQKVVPESPRGVLHRQSLRLSIGSHVDGFDGNWKTDARGQLAAELFVATCRTPEPVIQMPERRDAEPVELGKLQEQKEECDGIGPTGKSDQQSGTARTQPVSPDRSANLLLEVRQLR